MNLDPTPHDWKVLLAALADQAAAGCLASVTFMITDPAHPDRAVIDSYGRLDLTEIACRKTVESVAAITETTLGNPMMARAIRDGMPAARQPN